MPMFINKEELNYSFSFLWDVCFIFIHIIVHYHIYCTYASMLKCQYNVIIIKSKSLPFHSNSGAGQNGLRSFHDLWWVFFIRKFELVCKAGDQIDGAWVLIGRSCQIFSFPESKTPLVHSSHILKVTIFHDMIGSRVPTRHVCHFGRKHLQPPMGGERTLIFSRDLSH